MSQLSCSSFTAGIVEAVLDGLGFVSLLCFHIPQTDIFLARSRNRAQHTRGRIPSQEYDINKVREECARARRAIQIVVSFHTEPSRVVTSNEVA
jgi:hypothetical protein